MQGRERVHVARAVSARGSRRSPLVVGEEGRGRETRGRCGEERRGGSAGGPRAKKGRRRPGTRKLHNYGPPARAALLLPRARERGARTEASGKERGGKVGTLHLPVRLRQGPGSSTTGERNTSTRGACAIPCPGGGRSTRGLLFPADGRGARASPPSSDLRRRAPPPYPYPSPRNPLTRGCKGRSGQSSRTVAPFPTRAKAINKDELKRWTKHWTSLCHPRITSRTGGGFFGDGPEHTSVPATSRAPLQTRPSGPKVCAKGGRGVATVGVITKETETLSAVKIPIPRIDGNGQGPRFIFMLLREFGLK